MERIEQQESKFPYLLRITPYPSLKKRRQKMSRDTFLIEVLFLTASSLLTGVLEFKHFTGLT